MKKLFVLCLVAFALVACSPKENATQVDKEEDEHAMNEELIGKWAGDIELPNGSLPIIVDLQKESGTLSVPAQGVIIHLKVCHIVVIKYT